MTYIRSLFPIAVVTTTILATSAWAAVDDPNDSHYRAQTTAVQVAQAAPGSRGMGMRAGTAMPGYTDQMKAMQEMHDRMVAARTPEERNALMTEQMNLMQNGMSMMGRMGGMGGMGGMAAGAAINKPGDVAARQDLIEQRMDMMQSMMQMMMDRVQSVPATK